MTKKYIKRSGNIDTDYRHYLAQENLYHILWNGGTLKENRKASYIWRALLKEYGCL